MKKKSLIVAAMLFIAVLAVVGYVVLRMKLDARVEAALVTFDCPPVEPRVYPAGSYTGPLWDTHVHIPEFIGGPFEVSAGSIACTFQTEGTEKVFGFFSVYDLLAKPMVEVAARIIEAYPGQFVPFIMPPDDDNSPSGSPTVDAATLKEMLAIAPGLFI